MYNGLWDWKHCHTWKYGSYDTHTYIYIHSMFLEICRYFCHTLLCLYHVFHFSDLTWIIFCISFKVDSLALDQNCDCPSNSDATLKDMGKLDIIELQQHTTNETGPWFNIKMLSYQYRKSHCGDKTILRPSYLHNGISYTGKTASLYWIGALVCIICRMHCKWGIWTSITIQECTATIFCFVLLRPWCQFFSG